MAHGNPDYWPLIVSGLPIPSVEQNLWRWSDITNVAGGANVDGAGYTVLPGERLYISGLTVACEGPGNHLIRLYGGGAVRIQIVLDSFLYLPLSPSALMDEITGSVVRVRYYNRDDIAHTFFSTIFGFRVTIVPGVPTPAGLGLAIDGAGV